MKALQCAIIIYGMTNSRLNIVSHYLNLNTTPLILYRIGKEISHDILFLSIRVFIYFLKITKKITNPVISLNFVQHSLHNKFYLIEHAF